MLSQAAFNAFLKTLEEPPHHAIFILATTEKHKILPTILSRCQIYDFNRIGIKDTIDHLQYVAKLEHINAEPEALTVIAQKADGGMRDALSIFDQVVSFTGGNITYKSVIENLNVLDYEYYFKLTDLLLENKVPESMLLFNDVLKKGFDGSHFITGLSSHFRDLLVSKDPSTLQLLEVGAGIRGPHQAQRQQQPTMAIRLGRVDQAERAPCRHHREGAGGELEHPCVAVMVGGEVVVAQPQQGEAPPGDADQHGELEQRQRTALRGARSPDQRRHHRDVAGQEHGTGEGVLEVGELQPFPQRDQEHHCAQRGEDRRGREQDREDGDRRHDQGRQQARLRHWIPPVPSAATCAPVNPKRRSRPA